MKKNRHVLVVTTSAVLGLACGGFAEDPAAPPSAPTPASQKPAAPAATTASTPAWQVAFPAGTTKVGINEADLEKVIAKQFKDKWKKSILEVAKGRDKEMQKRVETQWANIWNVLLLQTPEIVVETPAFAISRFEVTNAQWEVFLQHRKDVYEVSGKAGDDTLEGVAKKVWGLKDDDMAGLQRGWQSILGMNEAVLQPILNPKKDVAFDPLKARAQQVKLPTGTKLTYYRYVPPPHWAGGALPGHERNLPVRNISYEQIMDFCFWAGVHLPTEAE